MAGSILFDTDLDFLEKTTRVLKATHRPTLCQSRKKMISRFEVCATVDVAEGTALKIETGDLVLAVFNIDGEFYVMDDTCTHGPGSLSEGYIDGDIVECNFHNGQFNIRTGEVVLPPCMIPQRVYAVTIEDGKVVIEIEP
jgi:nitrite reductase/ring-hydroxylating ferredoxin subunit